MKTGAYLPAAIRFLVAINGFMVAPAATLTTVQNSTLSVPAANLAPALLPSVTNLAGSNLMVSAVMPGTLQGGRASLINSLRWARRYNGGPASSQNAVHAMIVRPDGCVIVTGYSTQSGTGYDFATVCYAGNGTPLWTNRYDGSSHGNDTAGCLAADPNGNVWVVGESMRYATNSTLNDVITIKYASNGIPVWTNRYSSFETNGAYPASLAVDANGNAYVKLHAAYWGSYFGTPVEDAIIKYDAAGSLVWVKHYFASAPDSGQGLHGIRAMALDNAGNLIVAGDTGSEHYHTGGAIVKFASDGTAIRTNLFSRQVMSDLDLLSVDLEGNAIITGSRWSDNMTLNVAMKFAQEGSILWTNELPGPIYNGGNVPQTVLDRTGNVFVIGGSPGADTGLYRILKISSAGIPLWTNQNANFGATQSTIQGSATDNAGNLYLVGGAPATNGYSDFVTMKFSGDGQLVWSNRFNGPANTADIPFALAVSGAGDLYLAGRSDAQTGNQDFATVKYADLLFYSPPKDFVGVDTVTCQITDHLGHSATGSVDIGIAPGAFQFGLSPAATRMTSGGMLLQIEGAPSANAVVLEMSPDAVSWQPISTNAPSQGTVQFLDSAALNQIKRFYRVTQEQ